MYSEPKPERNPDNYRDKLCGISSFKELKLAQKNRKQPKIFDFHELAVYLQWKEADKHSSPQTVFHFTCRFHST
jgi:hypothetical protein